MQFIIHWSSLLNNDNNNNCTIQLKIRFQQLRGTFRKIPDNHVNGHLFSFNDAILFSTNAHNAFRNSLTAIIRTKCNVFEIFCVVLY